MAARKSIVSRLMGGLFARMAKYINLPGGIRIPYAALTTSQQIAHSAVFAAVSLISGHMASVPLHLFQRLPNGGKERVAGSAIDIALSTEASPGVSAYEMRETLSANIEYYGVGYLWAIPSGARLHLRTFNSAHVHPDRDRGIFEVVPDGVSRKSALTIPADQVIVIPTLSLDCVNPLHMTEIRRRSIGLAISYEERAEAYNRHGMDMSGIVTWGEGYNKKDIEDRIRLEKKFEELYQGVKNAGGVAFMPNGSKWEGVSFNPEQLQMLDARRFSVSEIARWFGVPPHKIGDLERSTNNNIEHQGIEYVQDALLRRVSKLESILAVALLPAELRGEYFFEHNLDGLLRGDFKTRMDGYSIAKNWGLRSTNQIAALENWSPVPKEDGGDTFYMPLNMAPTRQLESPAAAAGRARLLYRFARAQAMVRRQITDQYRPLFRKAAAALVESENEKMRAAAELLVEKKIEEFKTFVAQYYLTFEEDVRNGFSGVLSAYADQIGPLAADEVASKGEVDLQPFLAEYGKSLGRRWANDSRGQMQGVVNDAVGASEDPAKAVGDRLDEWQEKKAGKVQQNEPIRAESAISKAVWMAVGVKKLRWVALGDKCEYCKELDGKVIGIESVFLAAGSAFQPEGAAAFVPSGNVGHPGLHEGCACGVSAEI